MLVPTAIAGITPVPLPLRTTSSLYTVAMSQLDQVQVIKRWISSPLTVGKINRGGNEEPHSLVRSSHCVLIKKSWIEKEKDGPDTSQAKSNRHLDEIEGGTWGLEDIEKATNDLLQVSSLLASVSLSTRLWSRHLSPSSIPTPSRSRPLANGYLPCWKGLRFLTGERSTDNRTWAQAGEEKGANGKYIIHLGLPGDTDSSPRSCKGSEKGEKGITCQYLFPLAAPGLKQIHYVVLAQSQFKSCTSVWDQQGLWGSPGREILGRGLSLRDRDGD